MDRLLYRLCHACLFAAIVSLAVGCGGQQGSAPSGSPAAPTPQTEDLPTSRKNFVTKLLVRGPAPQQYQDEKPPPGVRQIEYPSGGLKLKGWQSADPGDGKRRPGVVYLHGGWAFGAEDWRDAAPFADAGFVLFMPMLRAENGNPGIYESFYGEVDDAIAAGKYVACLPSVDGDNVFLAGHSVGAVLTTLVAMMPSRYKAAAALSGYVDMESWVARSPEAHVPYDRTNPEEVRVRNPMAFASSLRCPLTLYVEPVMRRVNEPLARSARQAGKECELVVVPGDHLTMVAPAVKRAIEQFRARAGQTGRPLP
jgi:acetyl esterase/lipase